jgi:hypothetical protein
LDDVTDSTPGRSISGIQAIAIIAIALAAIAIVGSALGWWTLWVDVG